MGKWWRNRDRIRVSGNEALLVELERIRDEDDRQNKRIAVIEEDTKAIHKLTASIEKLVIQMQDMLSEQKEQSERIKRLEEEPGNAWNAVKKKAVDTVVGLVAGGIGNGAYLYDSPEYVKKGQSIMKKNDWVRKLTSRKLWTAVASFVSMMIVATGGAENTATQVTALIMAGASVVAYIIGEGLTDSANIGLEEGEVTEE